MALPVLTPLALVTPVVVALIGLGGTLVGAALALLANRNIARLSDKLQEDRAVRMARRDYQYEARKRLYTQCEPLLFQALELAEDARYRVENLAASARSGDLREDGSGWLAREGYYYKSAVFLLLAPTTTFKILQRRLTVIDLSLEPRIRTQYELLKLVWFAFASDWALAACQPNLPYEPDKADPGQPNREVLLHDNPAVYWRQGFYRGTLEMISEALITSASNHARERSDGDPIVERCQSMGEFWKAYDNPDSTIGQLKSDLSPLFTGFHPKSKPVLWRVFIAQYLLHGALQSSKGASAPTQLEPEPMQEDFTKLDWRRDPSEASDEEVYGSIRAAWGYVQKRLGALTSLELGEEAQ
jgi:hypothetical protein